jgi:hypothetical protein
MPEMIPVGNTGAVPNPLGSLSQMIAAKSGMIGLQQQQQNLQTGQYAQQSAQAGAQQDQQKNSEYQAAQQVAVNGAKSGKYTNSDGSLNRQQMADDILKVAPTYGPGISGQLLSQANEIVANKQALQNLNGAQRSQIGSTLGALASKPDVSSSDVIDTLTQLSEQNPAITRMALSFSHAIPPNATPQQLQQFLQRAALSATSPEGAVAASTPAQGTNAAGQNQNVNKLTGARTMPDLGPGATNPTGPQVSGAAARQTGTAGSDIDRGNQVSANVKSAPATIQTSQQIDDLADQIHSGKFVDWVSKGAAAVGVSEATYARQLLKKDLGIIQTQLTAAAPSDSRAATILSGTPDATSDTQTIHGAMDYVRGAARQNLAQGQNKSAYQGKHPDLAGFQQADDAFTGAAGPLVHEFLSLQSPAQKSEFYRRNFSTPQQALQFRNQAFAASHTLGLDNANR